LRPLSNFALCSRRIEERSDEPKVDNIGLTALRVPP